MNCAFLLISSLVSDAGFQIELVSLLNTNCHHISALGILGLVSIERKQNTTRVGLDYVTIQNRILKLKF